MSINPIEDNSTPKHTGSLEELFRHHLGEEAAVPPRPMLWDQIDNSLLIRQNEIYRKRLVATRWVAAASLLLATLAGTGWWAGRTSLLGGAEMATTNSRNASDARTGSLGNAAAARRAQSVNGTAARSGAIIGTTMVGSAPVAANNPANTLATGRAADASAGNAPFAGSSPNTSMAARLASAGSHAGDLAAVRTASNKESAGRHSSYSGFGWGTTRFQTAAGTGTTAYSAAGRDGAGLAGNTTAAAIAAAATNAPTLAARETLGRTDKTENQTSAGTAPPVASPAPMLAASGAAATGVAADVAAAGATAAPAVAPTEVSLLAARMAALKLGQAAALPNGLATVSVEVPAEIDAHRWHYGASYTAGIFNPNVNFSRKGIAAEFDYDRGPAFGTDSPALTEAAATEYRNNLRPGLSQRIALMATRHLRGHWSLSTGAEFTQATAQSASSSAFVGEQLFDLGQPGVTRPMRTTDFRYSMASIPLEVRYSNSVKRGWSLYGRLGGMVTALLGVRSDVQGDPEATRTYTIASAGTPYRRITGSLRGGAGTQFRTSTGKWAFTMGPTAEVGLLSLNVHPVQSYFAQSHPYSFGLEAGVEFGR